MNAREKKVRRLGSGCNFVPRSLLFPFLGREKEGKKRYPGNEVANGCNSNSILLGSASFMPNAAL